MAIKSTYIEEPVSAEDVVFKNVVPDNSVLYPNFTKSILIPSYTTKWEIMSDVDDPGSKESNKRRWKDCEHYKLLSPLSKLPTSSTMYSGSGGYPLFIAPCGNPYSFSRNWHGNNYIDWFGPPGQSNLGLPAYHEVQLDGSFIRPPTQLQALVSRSLDVLIPEMKSELSLVNSLIELKDFRSLPHSIGNLKQLARLIQKTSPKKVLKTFRDLSRVGADLFLQWKFNIRPLLADIRGIFTSINGLERRMNDLVSRSGKTQKRHFNYVYFEDPAVTDSGYVDTHSDQPVYLVDPYLLRQSRRQVFSEPSVFHAEIQYNVNYTEYQREHALVLGLLDRLGVNLDPSIIWNAIPWTFVIDWVIDVSSFLKQFKVRNMEPMLNIHQYLWSIKRSRRIVVTQKVMDVYPLAAGQEIPMPVIFESCYKRSTGIPAHSSLTGSGLNSSEFTLGAALVIARRSRRKK